jgi:hypothetical protein
MNKRPSIALLLVLSTAVSSRPASASSSPVPGREVRINSERLAQLPVAEQERILAIKERLETLMTADRSSLTRDQRSELRGEWKELKGEMREANRNGSVIYISTASLIIIILLLIILL